MLPAPAPLFARPTSRTVTRLLRHLRSPAGRADPYPVYAALRELGPAVPTPWGSLLLTGYEDCSRVVRSGDWLNASAAWRDRHIEGWRSGFAISELCRSLFLLDPPEHGRHRQAVPKGLTPRAVEALRPTVRRYVDTYLRELDDRIDREGRADFVTTVAGPLSLAVPCELIGLPVQDSGLLSRLIQGYTNILDAPPTRSQVEAADQAARTVHAYVVDAIEERRLRPRDDLLTELLRAPQGSDISGADFARVMTTTLLVAARETTVAVLTGMVQALDTHPEQAAWLRQHPEAVPGAVEELLRWDPPAQIIVRVAARDTEIRGIDVPEGGLVHALIGSAHRDPETVRDPDTLDLGRTPTTKLTFGVGIHYCVGAALARMEAAELLTALLERPRALRPAGPAEYLSTVTIRAVTRLPVVHAPHPQ